MKSCNRFFYFFLLSALVAVALGITPAPAVAADSTVCLPSCSPTDGRMFVISSDGLQTLAGQSIFLKIAAPQSMTSFDIDIFDGDTSGNWDQGSTPMVYTLFADPTGSQIGTEQVIQWLGDSMPDNDWVSFTVTQAPRAQAPSGDYFYYLRVDLPNAATTTQTSSGFKIRSTSSIELAANKSFSYMVPFSTKVNPQIIYPAYPTLTPTTFDGTWDIYLNVPVSQTSFAVWDGDTDYGSYDCSINDMDDPNTPNDVHPVWAAANSDVLEGVASGPTNSLCRDATGAVITRPDGQTLTTSLPADDNRHPAYRREPAVTYDVSDPRGNVYHNDNPSGNMEWEQFLIASDRSVAADYYADKPLPAGIYKVHVTGLDMSNLNAWHLVYDAVCVYADGTPCVPVLHPYKIGDMVWADTNGNGVQDAGEAGIAGATVTLLDANGNPVPNGTATTDTNGNYFFKVEAGTYTVRVDASNFNAGGALAGYTPTTPGGNSQTNTVTTENILTYDFGYVPLGSIGNLAWNDLNGNGIQDGSEAGIAGVTVNLLGSDGTTVLASTVTDATGNFSFSNLMPGTYYVQFVTPSGMIFTTANTGSDDALDSDVDASGKTAAITLSMGETNNTVDAGLIPSASIGDLVWNDLNGNGIQDSGEPGMTGVTVNLLGSDGATVVASTTTDAAGNYNFANLLPGTYYVQVLAPSQTTFTVADRGGDDARDSDVNSTTGKTAAITLSIGETDDTIDAGLKESLSLSCPNNLVLNPSFELNTGTPPKYWTNGTAGPINVPVVDGKNAAYITGSGIMYQKVNVTAGNSYTLTFYSGSHNPSIQTVKIQYYTKKGQAIGSPVTHTITSDLEVTGFGGPYTLTLGTAPSNAAYMKIMVSANKKDYAKVDKLCLQTGTPPATASIGDLVWKDSNGNGVQDSGEAGVAGVTVKLLSSDGTTVVATTTTDTAGNYHFTSLLPGTYYVQVVAPAGTTFTTANAGSDDAKDSDVDATGKTAAITLNVGETNNSVDAGLKESSSSYCSGNLVLNPSFELNTGTPPKYWTNGTAGNIGIAVDGKNVGYISGSATMFQSVNVTIGNSYTLTFYSGSHNPSIQTVKLQYLNAGGSTIGTAATHTITSDLQVTGFGGPYSLTLDAAPSDATSLKVMVSANGYDYAKVDKLCLQTTPPPAQVNYCSYVRSPGFWKNYSNHMSDAAFLGLISHTQDFSYLTVSQAKTILSTNNGATNIGIAELNGVDASYLKFLLSSELNAAWNGQDTAAAPGGTLGGGKYQGTGMTVNQVLHQAYLDRYNFSAAEKGYLEYLGAGGENADQNTCLVQP